MEDILASIRRIIADEGTGSEAPQPFDNEPSGFDESTTFSEETEEDVMSQAAADAEPEPEPEAEAVSIDDIDFDSISIDPEPEDASESVDDDDDELLELTDDMIADDGGAEPPEPVEPLTDDVAFQEGEVETEDPISEFDEAWGGSEDTNETPEPVAGGVGDVDAERLMSPATDAIVGSAFGRLANAILSNEARTVEDLIKEMLRPMLREWIDDNLPQVVERLVREEIERAARGR